MFLPFTVLLLAIYAISPSSARPQPFTQKVKRGTCPAAAPSFVHIGCFSDSPTNHLLNAIPAMIFPAGLLTPRSCQDKCRASNFTIAGVENGNTCTCASAYNVASGTGSPVSSSGCGIPCNGDATQTCGGPNAVDVYSTNSNLGSPSLGSPTTPQSQPTTSQSQPQQNPPPANNNAAAPAKHPACTPRTTSTGPASGSASSSSKYTLLDSFTGKDFFQWDFFTDPDPTHGDVVYVDQKTAIADSLVFVDGNGLFAMTVDNTTNLPPGVNRNSVRISSPSKYNEGTLWLIDLRHIPYGCAVWPAYWAVGEDWPNGGEIDIIEGVNTDTHDLLTWHTGGDDSSCTLNNNPVKVQGTLNGGICLSSGSSNNGCGYTDPSPNSYGQGFAANGGGVWGTVWNKTGIYHYRFDRNAIPEDITSGNPNPASWPEPEAALTTATCDVNDRFTAQNIVFDITLCGDFAGATYASSGCPGTCSDQVQKAANFDTASFRITYLKIFQQTT